MAGNLDTPNSGPVMTVISMSPSYNSEMKAENRSISMRLLRTLDKMLLANVGQFMFQICCDFNILNNSIHPSTQGVATQEYRSPKPQVTAGRVI